MLVFFAMLALASSEREYLTDRPDALGAYMRCASEAFDEDTSIGYMEAKDRIKVECRPFRDQAIEIFVPLYQQRMRLPEPITDAEAAERTILGVVLAEQMRREEEALLNSPEAYPDNGAPPIRVIPQTWHLEARTICILPSDDDVSIRQIAKQNGVTIQPTVDENCSLVLLSNKAPKMWLPQIYSAGPVRTINSASCITDYRGPSPGFAGAAAIYYVQQKPKARLTCMAELLTLIEQK